VKCHSLKKKYNCGEPSSTPSPPFDNIYSYGDCLEVKREYYLTCFIIIIIIIIIIRNLCSAIMPLGGCNINVLPLQWAQLTQTVHTARWAVSLSLCLLGCMIYLYVHVCFVLPWSVESFSFMFWRWRNKLK